MEIGKWNRVQGIAIYYVNEVNERRTSGAKGETAPMDYFLKVKRSSGRSLANHSYGLSIRHLIPNLTTDLCCAHTMIDRLQQISEPPKFSVRELILLTTGEPLPASTVPHYLCR